MTYAGDRRILDADSHLMELPDFLTRHASGAMRDRIPRIGEVRIVADGIRMREYRGRLGHPPEVVEKLTALGDDLTRGPKWHDALGAFNTVLSEQRHLDDAAWVSSARLSSHRSAARLHIWRAANDGHCLCVRLPPITGRWRSSATASRA